MNLGVVLKLGLAGVSLLRRSRRCIYYNAESKHAGPTGRIRKSALFYVSVRLVEQL